MKIFFLILFFSKFIFAAEASSAVFRYHLQAEPTTLSVLGQKNSSAGYFLAQVNGSLVSYRDGEIIGNLAEHCRYQTLMKLVCKLKSNLKWSDGSGLTPADFILSYQKFLNPINHAYRADLLFPVKNAKKIYEGSADLKSLGVTTNKNEVIFTLEAPDSEFIYSLTSPLLSPQKDNIPEKEMAKNLISSGPYRIKDWILHKKIILENNPYYYQQDYLRPNLEILFINDDSVALNLYEKGELDFLRRLPTLYIDKYKSRKDFFAINLSRFDYIGFGPALRNSLELRKALSLSLDFLSLQKLFSATSPPGCSGLSEALYDDKRPCLVEDIPAAQNALKEAKQKLKSLPTLDLLFSNQGGEDHKRATEWMQAEWKKNLRLTVNLEQLENKIFVTRLESQPPTLFRKGVGPDRPTCLSALEVFAEESPENYLKITDPKFQDLLKKMKTSTNEREKKSLCSESTKYLLNNYLLIPTGPMYFSLLVRPEFSGWHLNELNQLDLSELRMAKSSTKK